MAIRKRNGKWLAVIFRGYETGADRRQRRLEHTRTFTLKKDAERWVREQRAQLEQGTWIPASTITLGQFLDEWERGALRLSGQRDRTKANYCWLLTKYVRPKLGPVRLDHLSRAVIQRFAAELLAQPNSIAVRRRLQSDSAPVPTLSPVTVRRTLAALSVALQAGVEQRLLASNPAQRIALPRPERKPIRWLTRQEVRTLVDITRTERHGALWLLLAYTGMRPGEALGLVWDNVDLHGGVVRVQQALVPVTKGSAGRSWRIDEPKTCRSRRAVPIPDDVTRALRSHRAQQAAERLAAGDNYSTYPGGGFVFARIDGEPYRADGVLQVFQRTLQRIGLPKVSLYSLRHGHASLLLEAGIPLKVVSERLGHSSIQLTADTYSHVSDQLQQRAMEQFEEYMA